MIRKLYRNKSLRALVLPVLKAVNRDISIEHHWTKDRFRLNLFRHKGYWFHGAHREAHEMDAISALVFAGDIVVEVGGHIGYLSLLFAKLTGVSGHAYIFEPGRNNLPYLRHNLRSLENVTVIEKGCGRRAEKLNFYQDNLTGQNNSFVQSFDGLARNAENAPNVRLEVDEAEVAVVRLDEELAGISPTFVKIDVEGFELSVLEGATRWFEAAQSPPIFMIEVQADHRRIEDWFATRGYHLFDNLANELREIPEGTTNLFAIHPVVHAQRLGAWRRALGGS